jgi:hypothetical protein
MGEVLHCGDCFRNVVSTGSKAQNGYPRKYLFTNASGREEDPSRRIHLFNHLQCGVIIVQRTSACGAATHGNYREI